MQVSQKTGKPVTGRNAGKQAKIWKQFLSAAVFEVPALFPVSAWTEHLPFAFWLVESLKPTVLTELGTHYGLSYFGFCQAVQRNKFKTKCFAVDNWQGDEHAGFYDGSVYQFVNSINQQYSDFSTLLRMGFDEAQPGFEDGSIDLLHIDGLHTYEAVKHDFENWLPKLSDKAVVLFHDTHVTDRGFGVHQFWAELKESYPNFEFSHGFGLGVLAVGKNLPKKLSRFFESGNIPGQPVAIQQAYGRLGLLFRLEQEHQHLSDEIIEYKTEKVTEQLEETPVLPQTANGMQALHEICIQVFWKHNTEIFNEQDSVSQVILLQDERDSCSILLPPAFKDASDIRIDPGNAAGALYCYAIEITNADGQPIFGWDKIKNSSTFHNLIVMKSIFTEGAYAFLSLNSDPIIEIKLPPLDTAGKPGERYVVLSVSKITDELLKKELNGSSLAILKTGK